MDSIISPKANHHDNAKLFADLLVYGAFYAATGALAGHLFSLVTPVGGAAFGAAMGIASAFAAAGLDRMFGDSTNEKIVKYVGRFLLSIAAGVGAALAIGAKLTMINGIYLSILMIPVSFITVFALGCIKSLAEK